MAEVPTPGWAQRHPVLVFQMVIWALMATLAVLPAPISPAVPFGRAAGWVLSWSLTGVGWSSVMAALFARLPDRALRSFRAVLTIVPSALLASALWLGTMWLLEPLTGKEPWLPPALPLGREYTIAFVRGSMLLLVWSGLFLVNLLSTRVQREREHSLEARAMANQAQVQLLRSQLNPHFLFNALNSVVALIGENPGGARSMVRDIATLLRRSLDSDGLENTTVKEELEFVQLYLKCEQTRFEDKLRVTLDVAEGLGALRVPSMLLHPLVENAVKHGLENATALPLVVKIVVKREAGQLVFEVDNTGTLQQRRDPLLPATTGIGIQNIRARLEHLFPGRHAFELFERDGHVIARVVLPEVT
jgi:two-component sensor histidine kinase